MSLKEKNVGGAVPDIQNSVRRTCGSEDSMRQDDLPQIARPQHVSKWRWVTSFEHGHLDRHFQQIGPSMRSAFRAK